MKRADDDKNRNINITALTKNITIQFFNGKSRKAYQFNDAFLPGLVEYEKIFVDILRTLLHFLGIFLLLII